MVSVAIAPVAIAHHFQSSDWYSYLSKKIPMPEDGFSFVKRLKPGEALVVCTKMACQKDEREENEDSASSVLLKIRPRVTIDYGASKTA